MLFVIFVLCPVHREIYELGQAQTKGIQKFHQIKKQNLANLLQGKDSQWHYDYHVASQFYFMLKS